MQIQLGNALKLNDITQPLDLLLVTSHSNQALQVIHDDDAYKVAFTTAYTPRAYGSIILIRNLKAVPPVAEGELLFQLNHFVWEFSLDVSDICSVVHARMPRRGELQKRGWYRFDGPDKQLITMQYTGPSVVQINTFGIKRVHHSEVRNMTINGVVLRLIVPRNVVIWRNGNDATIVPTDILRRFSDEPEIPDKLVSLAKHGFLGQTRDFVEELITTVSRFTTF